VALQAVGLRTYIWNNNLKSLALLAGFPILLIGVAYAIVLLIESASAPSITQGLASAGSRMPAASLVALGVSGAWFAVAYVGHQKIIDLATGSREATRADHPELYNLLENLCVSRGMPMPKLRIIETEALNAFASGLSEQKAVVTVTRGLVNALDRSELEAVLAHELSHIRHRDVRLLVIAAVFVGIISVVGEMVFRGMFRVNTRRTTSRGRRGGGGNAGVLVLIAFAIIALSYLLAIVVRFALSRRREFLADAGAVELTKNPDAMISALRKISGHSDVPRAPDEVREMFFDNRPSGFASLFATHPPIEARIAALVLYAGGREAIAP
jgi:heat shock protein HtpX